MTDRTVIDFDHQSPKFAADSVAGWNELRSRCPVAYSSQYGGFWVLTGYEEVTTVARDDVTFSSFHNLADRSLGAGVMIPPTSSRFGLIEDDGEVHRELRRVLLPFFTKSAIEKVRPLIVDSTERAIDSFIEAGYCDLVIDFCAPVPAAATVELLALGDVDVVLYGGVFHKHQYAAADPQAHQDVIDGMKIIDADIANAIASRRDRPRPNDPITALCGATIDGQPLSDQQITDVMRSLIGGGLDTTSSLLATTLVWLAQNPDELKRLVKDPTLLSTAAEEFLRYFAPSQALSRTVMKECELSGTALHPGERVMLSWAAANHDPREFDRPEQMLLDRSPNRHTSFGVGGHRCIGSTLARVEFEIMLGAFLRRIPDFVVDFERAARYPSVGQINGYITVPTTFPVAPRSSTD